MRQTVAFDAASLDDFLTGFRGVPGLLEFMARNLEQQPDTGGSEIEQRNGCTIIQPDAWRRRASAR